MHFDATNPDSEVIQCSVCEKQITGHRWFARVACGDILIALCSPICVEMYQEDSLPYRRRIEELAHAVHE